MDLRRTQSWLSIAVLVVGIAAPLRGREVRATGRAATDARVPVEMAWDRTCGSQQDAWARAGMQETSYAELTCAANGTAPVEIAELFGTDRTSDRFAGSFGVPELGGGSFQPVSSAQAASFVAEMAAAPPQDAPKGTKIPEPGTLALLGAGMIAVSRVSRTKMQPKTLLRLVAAGFNHAQLNSASGD